MTEYNHENDGTVNPQLNDFDQFFTISNKKLDADQYNVDDIDGVTEGLFGSGNMIFAILQSSQANNAGVDKGFDPSGSLTEISGGQSAFNNGSFIGPMSGKNNIEGNGKTLLGSDRPVDIGSYSEGGNVGLGGNLASLSVGTIAATSSIADGGKYALTSTGGGSSSDGSITNITNVGDTGDITTIIQDIMNLGDDIVNNLIEGDIVDIVNIVNNEVNELVEIVNQTINDLTENIYEFIDATQLTEIINNITNIVYDVKNIITDIIDGLPVDLEIALDLELDVLDTLLTDLSLAVDDSVVGALNINLEDLYLEQTLGDLTGLDFSILPNAGLGLDFNLLSGENIDDGNDILIAGLDTPNIDLDIVEDIVGDIDLTIELPVDVANLGDTVGNVQSLIDSLGDLDPASPEEFLETLGEQTVEGLLDATILTENISEDFDISLSDAFSDAGGVVEDLTGDLTGDVTGDLLGSGDGTGDEDVSLSTDLGDLDINLDPVEDLVGDVDLDVDLSLLGPQSGEDQDGSILADLDVADQDILGTGNLADADMSNILPGDTDLDLGLGADLLSDNADEVVNDGAGGTGEETLLAEVGDGLSDVGESLVPEINEGLELALLSDNEFFNDSLGSNLESDITLLNPDGDDGGSLLSGDDIESWTESALPEADGIFGDAGGDTLNDILPDPSGSVGEGLGALDTGSDLDVSGLGGLFG